MSNFPIQIDRQELKEWHEFARQSGFDSTAAFVRMAVRERIKKDWFTNACKELKQQEAQEESSNELQES